MRLMINLEEDDPVKVAAVIEFWTGYKTNNTSQSTLTNNKTDKDKEHKYYCNNPGCKKEITKDIVAYCLHTDNKDRFKGKVYCRECQGDHT